MKRINLVMAAALAACALQVSAQHVPDYINLDANRIQMNGADWSGLSDKLQSLKDADTTRVRVLHIGDSHIQAEFVTNRLRELLQARYGNAGRGLMVPLRLAGTNQSHDFSATSPLAREHWTQTRLLKTPWPARPGMTGIAARPDQATTVTWHTTVPGHDIVNATLITDSGLTPVSATGADSLTTDIAAGQAVYGLLTDNGRPGLLYSAIGNNGACYYDYLLIRDFPQQTALFNPDLIVLSMGTNEAFSYNTDAEIERSVRDMVTALRHHNPNAQMLILGPMECQKNRRHGQRPLSPDFDILERNHDVSVMLSRIAADMGVPYWDFYTVAGGHGASDKWLADKLMNQNDHIHLLKAGYELEAQLLFDALTHALN